MHRFDYPDNRYYDFEMMGDYLAKKNKIVDLNATNATNTTNSTANETKNGKENHEHEADVKDHPYTSGKFEYPDMRYYPFEHKGDYISSNYMAKNDDKKSVKKDNKKDDKKSDDKKEDKKSEKKDDKKEDK